MKFTKIGMRTIKTVIAVIITLGISEVFKLKSPILAGIAAIMTMEGSVSESLDTGKHRMYGTILGGAIALVIGFIAPENFLFIGLGLIIIINTCNVFKIEKSARMAMVVFLVIILNYKDGDGFSYAINRTLDTLVGVIIGTATNYLIRPPRVDKKIKKLLDTMYVEVKELIINLIWKDSFGNLDNMKQEIIEIEENYELFREDTKLHIGISENMVDYKNPFDSFEQIWNHLSVINSIKENPRIDEKNQSLLEEYFQKEIPEQEVGELDDLDLIYNFHLNKILVKFQSIERRLYK